MRWLPLLLVSSVAFADAEKLPRAEVITNPPPVQLPPIPTFEVIAPEGDVHAPHELIHVARTFGKEVRAAGYVVAIYSCTLADRKQCARPRLWLGDTRTMSQDRAAWVVDIPEKGPKLAVGDYVVVRGTFDLTSPHKERNSDGIIVYAGVQKLKPPAQVKMIEVPAEPPLTLAPVVAPPRAPVDDQHRQDSYRELNAGNRFNGKKQFDDAVAAYQRAIELMHENHLAWYGLGGAHAGKGAWAIAAEAFARAAAIVPDAPMYQLWLGVALFERERARDGNLELAREPLLRAVQAEPRLWRASYYLGRLARERGYPAEAATWFTRAITSNPYEVSSFGALTELYVRWSFYAQAIEVGNAGRANTVGGQRFLMFVVGIAYAALQQHAEAIDAFTLAIDNGNTFAYHYRARERRALGDTAGAKQDYEQALGVDKGAYVLEEARKALAELR